MDRDTSAHRQPADPVDPVDAVGPAGGAPAVERRGSLRQYQVQLLERMQAARTGGATGVRELGVVIGGRHYLLDLTQIGEIVTPQQVAPVPLTRPWYLGLANIRGDLTGVIDLARYQAHGEFGPDSGPGPGPGGLAAERRLVTFSPKLGFNCALLADRVLGLRTSADMRAAAAPAQALEDEAPAWGARRFDDADGRRWTLLDLAQLVREPRFAQVGF